MDKYINSITIRYIHVIEGLVSGVAINTHNIIHDNKVDLYMYMYSTLYSVSH